MSTRTSTTDNYDLNFTTSEGNDPEMLCPRALSCLLRSLTWQSPLLPLWCLVTHNITSHLFYLHCDIPTKLLFSKSGLKCHKYSGCPVTVSHTEQKPTHGLVYCVPPNLTQDMVSQTEQKSTYYWLVSHLTMGWWTSVGCDCHILG